MTQPELAALEASIGGLLQASITTRGRVLIRRFAERVVQRTPVDTGHLKANWQLTVGSPATNELPGVADPLPAIYETLESADPGKQEFFLTNNTPYAEYIEYDGHSSKAPDGMLRISAEEATRLNIEV